MPKVIIPRLTYEDENGSTALYNVQVWVDNVTYAKVLNGADPLKHEFALYPDTIAEAKLIIKRNKEKYDESQRTN